MKRYLILPLLALAAVACSQGSGSTNPIGPSIAGSTEMVGDARNSCPSDAPGNFHITSGELIGTRWKNYVQFEPVVKTMRYYVELKRRLSDEPAVAFGSWTLTLSGMPSGLMVNIERYDLPDGIYNARIRSICGDTPQGNWSQWVEFVNGDSSFGPNVPPPTDPCQGVHATSQAPDPCAPPPTDPCASVHAGMTAPPPSPCAPPCESSNSVSRMQAPQPPPCQPPPDVEIS